MTIHHKRILSKEQLIQEDQYVVPYHYTIHRHSARGLFYYSYLDTCIQAVDSMGGTRLLDIGCGDGFLLNNLNDALHELHGIDYSPRAIDLARLMTSTKKIFYTVGDISSMPYEDGMFDIITNIAVLEHMPPEKIQSCIREMSRVCSSSGKIIVALPTNNLKKPEKHYQHFNLEAIQRIFEPYFELSQAFGCYHKGYDTWRKLCDNRLYEIKPISKYLRKVLFAKYWKRSEIDDAKMIVAIMEKIKP